MILSLSDEKLMEYTSNQLNTFFPDGNTVSINDVRDCFEDALKRLDYCYSHVSLKHYFDGKQSILNHLFGDQYLMFIWFLANSIFKKHQKNTISDKLYLLNKTLFSIDCMYDTKLPDIFLIFHGAGTMLGKAAYSDFFVVLQGCTIGSHKGKYPVMDKGVSLTAHSSIVGDCTIGKNVSLSAYTNLFETNIEDNKTVFRNKDGKIIIKESVNSYAQIFFNGLIK